MNASPFQKLAAEGHRVPIATHLILHEESDPAVVELDGDRLGDVVARTAERFESPLAIPLMDLKIEKEAILTAMGIPSHQIESYHFDEVPGEVGEIAATPRMQATCGAISRVATKPMLVPMGMCIGPFSLMTKLVSDPITPVFLIGEGTTAEEDEDVATVERCLEIGLEFVLSYITDQVRAGAKGIIVCEPAANNVYFSPNQLANSFDVFDRFVIDGLRAIKARLDELGADFVLHDCGELIPEMVQRFGVLKPAMLSLGSSRTLWEDAQWISQETVLYGNMPSKRFYAKDLTTGEVDATARQLLEKMRACGHPFILGSECDILSVPGSEDEIMAKVAAMMRAGD